MPQPARGFLIAWIACILAIAVALCALIGRAHAAEPHCTPLAAAQAEIAAIIDKAGGFTATLTAAETRRYLDIVNASPPETHLAGEGLLFLSIPERGVVLGVINGGQACIAGRISTDLHERALRAARGDGA